MKKYKFWMFIQFRALGLFVEGFLLINFYPYVDLDKWRVQLLSFCGFSIGDKFLLCIPCWITFGSDFCILLYFYLDCKLIYPYVWVSVIPNTFPTF